MTIQPQTRNRYSKKILSTIKDSPAPLDISQLLEKVRESNVDFQEDLAVALVWHLLATRKLRFDASRRLESTVTVGALQTN